MICLGKRKVQLRKKIIIKCLREARFITVKFKIIKSVKRRGSKWVYESLENVQCLLCKCWKSPFCLIEISRNPLKGEALQSLVVATFMLLSRLHIFNVVHFFIIFRKRNAYSKWGWEAFVVKKLLLVEDFWWWR